jgi:acetyl esterase/lipase
MAVDPNRIGVLGFSSTAMTTLAAALEADASQRPAFVASIYGALNAREVPQDAPPLFAAIAFDDAWFSTMDLGLVKSWRKAKAPVELHLYERGGHGFGASEHGTSSDHWREQFYWWLSARGLLNNSNTK